MQFLFLYHSGRSLDSSGCYNRIPLAGWHKQQFYFSQFWQLEKKIKMLKDSVSGGEHRQPAFIPPSKSDIAFWGLFCKGTNSIHKVSILITSSPLNGPSPHAIILGGCISTLNCRVVVQGDRRDKHSVYNN
jgi:hypothetical protein